MTPVDIARLISTHKFEFEDESMLQMQIAVLLHRHGVEAEREVRITAGDRLDLLAGSVAIEVKIAGSRPQVITQLHRYAQSDRVTGIVLVTRKARHLSMPDTLNGKDVRVANLIGSSF